MLLLVTLASVVAQKCGEAVAACDTSCAGCTLPSLGPGATDWFKKKCCLYPGLTATVLAFEEDSLWADRLAEFNKCTGARISVRFLPGDEEKGLEGEDLMPDALIADVGTKTGDGSGLYDGYIVAAPWLPPVVDFLEDLTPRIAADLDLVNWEDINSASRAAVSFNGSVRALPLDTDYIAMGWREDVLTSSQVPQTIEELATLSEQLNGKDHNGDGVPDWGFCFTPQSNYFVAFLAPILQRTVRECAGPTTCKGVPTGQNAFFDTETFEPLIGDNPGFIYALRQYRRVMASSNCQEQKGSKGERKCNRKTAFPTGRCAGLLSMPGTMNKLLLPHDKGGKYSAVVKDADGAVTWVPTGVDGRHWGRRARFPGSSKVLVDGRLVDCTNVLCPKGEAGKGGGIVNFGPFFSEGGESYALPFHSKPAQKNAVWDMFLWLAQLPPNELPLSGQYRTSHLSQSAKDRLLAAGWPQTMADDLFNVLGSYFAPADKGNNQVQDLLIRGFSDYMGALNTLVNKEFLLNSQRSDDGRILPTFAEDILTDDAAFEKHLPTLMAALGKAFNDVTEQQGGRMVQLQRWRQALGVPFETDNALCARQLGRAAYEALGCDPPVNLCREHRAAVEAYQPGACADSSNVMAAILTTVGVIAGLLLVFGGGRMVYSRLQQLKKAEARAKKQMRESIANAKKTTAKLMYPMCLIRATDVLEAGGFVKHEELRDSGKLVFCDHLDGVAELTKSFSLLFISHQWLSFYGPDFNNVQFDVLKRAITTLLEKKHWESLDKVLVWLDFSCIPQANPTIQQLAIHSLPQYACGASTFLILAPRALHEHTEEWCDYASYQRRAWCRAEVLSHSLGRGMSGMFLADENGVEKVSENTLGDALEVFGGDLTCCRLKHEGMDRCDRESLVLPILGLYGELYGRKKEDPGRKSVLDGKDTAKLFPPKFTMVRHGSMEQVDCFSEMVQAMEEKVDEEIQSGVFSSSGTLLFDERI